MHQEQREIECTFLVLHRIGGKFYHAAPGELFYAWVPRGWSLDACIACVEMGNAEQRTVHIVPFEWGNPHALPRKLYRTHAIRPGHVIVPSTLSSKI